MSGSKKISAVGYAYVRSLLKLAAFPVQRPALARPVARVQRASDHLAIPPDVAPDSADPLAHLQFALKHEGVNLAILMEALATIPGSALWELIRSAPGSRYARVLCYLWEHANGVQLDDLPQISGASVRLFDPERYITGPSQRASRWRVEFNGLGSIRYCAMVERSTAIEEAISADLVGQMRDFATRLDPIERHHLQSWAYRAETEASVAIERETLRPDRERAFVAALQECRRPQPLTEDYLSHLQRQIVDSPSAHAHAFRSNQNYLIGPFRGAAAVTYVPPPALIARELMHELMAFANRIRSSVEPLIAASVVSSGLALIHPFGDGNGRLSRLLFHYALCAAGALPDGLTLPVSVAMRKNEVNYLFALESFSRPARDRWHVSLLGGQAYEFTYRGDPAFGIYRYWDATECVEFGLRMARQALDIELTDEATYLARYTHIYRAVNSRYDVENPVLATLVKACLSNGGVVPRRHRVEFLDRVPSEAVFDRIEAEARNSAKLRC